MGRIRTIKPDFFTHWGLYELEKLSGLPIRVAFAGLFTVADREGRFKWVPQELKIACIPHDEVDFSRVLDALMTRGFIVKYECDGRYFGYIPGFVRHQAINNREKESILPEPNENNCLTRDSRVLDACSTREVNCKAERKGKEGKGRERKGTTESAESSDQVEDLLPKEKPPKRKPKKQKHTLPDDFQITDDMRKWFEDRKRSGEFTIDMAIATEKWRNAMRAKGFEYVDWIAAWRNGMSKAQEWYARDNPKPKYTNPAYRPAEPMVPDDNDPEGW